MSGTELRPGEKAEGYAEEDKRGDGEMHREPVVRATRVDQAFDRENDRDCDDAGGKSDCRLALGRGQI